jgi:sugar/nucleoside kinase (ribokinase family)
MRILVVGSVALDTIHTPDGEAIELLGGSASYFSLAAAQFAEVAIVAVVGEDFPGAHRELLASRGIDLRGLEQRPGQTFRWEGRYGRCMKERETLRTDLGVFEGFQPILPPAAEAPDALFLANIDPDLQRDVLGRVGEVALTAVDTMNFWISRKRASLDAVVARADLLLLNDEELLELTDVASLPAAAQALRERGPEVVVIKKGPHGAAALGPWGWLALPAVPVVQVADPTGAGDTFAGGLIGYLAGRDWRQRETFATGLGVATAVASLAVEAHGVAALARLGPAEISGRCRQLAAMTAFQPPELGARRAAREVR